MVRLWLLDFDGTLVDSEKAIKACYLKIGQELVPDRCNFIETMIIGPTLDESSRMILTDKKLHLLDEFKNRFQQLYDNKLVYDTPQYPQVDETLNQLYSKGDNLCIVTNKRAYPTHKLIDHYGWQHLFKWVVCMDEYPKAKEKSDLIKFKKIEKNKYSEIFLVGDTLSDEKAANKNCIPFIHAAYGYGKNQDWKDKKIFKRILKFAQIIEI